MIKNKINLYGTFTKPRLSIFNSNKHIYFQLIDDINKNTIFSLSTLNKKTFKNLNSFSKKIIIIFLIKKIINKLLFLGIKKILYNNNINNNSIKTFINVFRLELKF
jgi:large subunit ribosomal protein L18